MSYIKGDSIWTTSEWRGIKINRSFRNYRQRKRDERARLNQFHLNPVARGISYAKQELKWWQQMFRDGL